MNKRFKIFQRIVALLCLIVLLPCLVAVPASAEGMNNFMDLVDAGYFETMYKLSPTDNRIEIPFGDYTLMKYIDFVFSRSSTTPKRIFVVSYYDGSRQQLYTESIGNNMFRAYGLIGVHSSTKYYLEFETTGTTYIYPYTCKVSLNTGSAFPDVGKMFVSDGHNYDVYYEMEAPNSSVRADLWYPSTLDNPYIYQYFTDIWIDNWIKYDYIVVQFSIADANLNSLCCYLDDAYVPFDISVIGDVDLFQYDVNETGGVIRYFPNGLDSVVHVSMRIDLTEVFRSDKSELAVHITGMYSTQDSSICLNSVTGYLSKDITETDTLWIKMKKFFTDLFAPDGAQEDADNFESDVNEKNEELGEMTDIMNSVEKPNVEDINMSIDSLVDPSVLAVSTEGLSSILGNQVILRILILSLTMATVGYVLFGKR